MVSLVAGTPPAGAVDCCCWWSVWARASWSGTAWLSSRMKLERVVGDRKISWWSGTSRRVLVLLVSFLFLV